MAQTTPDIQQRFNDALAALVERVRQDRSILAAVLCGSLSHDTVWARSDIDLALITTDDKHVRNESIALNADGVNVHAMLFTRAQFRGIVEGSTRNSFMHSLFAKGRLLYTHDQTIAELFNGLQTIGSRDTRIQLLSASSYALMTMYKARKWFITRGDLEYTALWILYTAMPLAVIEVLNARQLVGREAILQALQLNPSFFNTVYTDLLNQKKTVAKVEAALKAIDEYIASRAEDLFAPIIAHLREVGEIRSCTEIDDHFKRNYGIDHVTTACEYLADRGLIRKASAPVQLTKKSNITVEELAFFYGGERPDAL